MPTSLQRLRKPNSFRAWLCGIVVNLCKNHLRRPRVETLSLELIRGGHSFDSLPFSVSPPQPQEVAQARETHRLILATVAQLSPANQKAVLLYYFEQLSVREIAALLQISVPLSKADCTNPAANCASICARLSLNRTNNRLSIKPGENR